MIIEGDMSENEEEKGQRVLVGHFAADADPDAIVDAIIAALPPDKRPIDDPTRIAYERAKAEREGGAAELG
jgi:hypothetical protein